jgi:hypothetical protein
MVFGAHKTCAHYQVDLISRLEFVSITLGDEPSHWCVIPIL